MIPPLFTQLADLYRVAAWENNSCKVGYAAMKNNRKEMFLRIEKCLRGYI
jgi:hypothetical protein